jgi:hypothetical protein
MSTHPNAGKPAPKDILIDVSRLEAAFYEEKPDPADPNQLVSFGTSGHRGTSLNATFTGSKFVSVDPSYARTVTDPGAFFVQVEGDKLYRRTVVKLFRSQSLAYSIIRFVR